MRYLILILAVLFYNQGAVASGLITKHTTKVEAIMRAADIAEIPRELLLAVCYVESHFKTKGVTHIDGGSVSHGICQVKLESAKHMDMVFRHKNKATRDRLENIFLNAFYAAKLIKYQLNRYDDDWKLAVDAYNKGTAVGHNTKYVKKVQGALKVMRAEIPSLNRTH